MAENTTAVLVALPRPLDPIRLIGEEDKHATLLFFGETATLPEEAKPVILAAVARAVKLFNPFSEEIIDVSRLGSDDPPALVAKLSSRKLGSMRDVLLMDPKLSDYLSNATQHPNFTPHVTFGYPDYQGEDALRQVARNVYSIEFDRLALWWGDEQIEFRLGFDSKDMDVATHEDELDKFFAHVGVKGMHWGIRKQPDGSYKINPETGKVKVPAIRGKDGELTPLSPKGGVASVDSVNRHVTETLIKAKGIDSLTNVEIKAFVDRLDLEKRYSKHLSDQQQKKGSVKKFIASVAGNEIKQFSQGKKGPVLTVADALREKGTGKHKK